MKQLTILIGKYLQMEIIIYILDVQNIHSMFKL